MGAARYVELSEAEDKALQKLEQGKGIHQKVRLRASIVRLNNQGWSVPRLSRHYSRSQDSIHQDLDRWEDQGIEGMADKPQAGNNRVLSEEMAEFMKKKLAEERAWDCTQLSDAMFKEFKVRVKREAIRMRLLAMGYSWQRSRYEPGKDPDPLEVEKAKANIETLKRGHWIRI